MNPNHPYDLIDQQRLASLTAKINQTIERYPDKDWNYSRISLHIRALQSIDGPYVLWIEQVPTKAKKGQSDLKTFLAEVTWGERHSSELGILEIISLRLNKALLELTSDDVWDFQRPIIRVVSKESLAQQGVREALWYEVREVSGEDFDSR